MLRKKSELKNIIQRELALMPIERAQTVLWYLLIVVFSRGRLYIA